MDRLGFRIQLDLSEYFDDIRRLCWIFVDVNEHRFINDLIAHIKEVVPISGSFVLIFDNGILPFSESVHVLKEGDVVRVCRIEDGLFSSSITPPSKIETNGSVVSSEKLEEKHPGFLQNRRDASVDSVDASNYNDEAQLGSYEKEHSKKSEKKHKRSFPKISISSISEEKITPEESINDSYSLINEINKHKSRKRKATNETVEKLSSNSMTLEKRVSRIEDGLFSSSITPPSKIKTNGSVVSSEKLEGKHPGFLQNRRDASLDSVDASNYNDEAQLGSYEKGQSEKKHKRSFPKISISRVSRIEDGLFSSSITPPSKIKTNGSVVSSEKLEGKHPGFLQNRRDASVDSVDASNYNDEAQLGSYEKEHSKKSEKKHKRSFPKISISSISEGKITPEESINDSYTLINEINNKHKSRKRKATNETVATPGFIQYDANDVQLSGYEENNTCYSKKSKKKRKHSHSENILEDTIPELRNGILSEEITCIDEHNTKEPDISKRKSVKFSNFKKDVSVKEERKHKEITSANNIKPVLENNFSLDLYDDSCIKGNALQDSVCDDEDSLQVVYEKRRRHRIRGRKRRNNAAVKNIDINYSDVVEIKLPKSVTNDSKYSRHNAHNFIDTFIKNKHIRFLDSDNEQSSKTVNGAESSHSSDCVSNDINNSNSAGVLCETDTHKTVFSELKCNNTVPISTNFSEVSLVNADVAENNSNNDSLSVLENENLNEHSLNEPVSDINNVSANTLDDPGDGSQGQSTNLINDNENILELQKKKLMDECMKALANVDPKSYQPLKRRPAKGDMLQFKCLRLTERCNPELSKPIVGRVVCYYCPSQTVEVMIIDGHSELVPAVTRFTMEEYQEDINVNCPVVLNWSEVYEPLLIQEFASEQKQS